MLMRRLLLFAALAPFLPLRCLATPVTMEVQNLTVMVPTDEKTPRPAYLAS